MTRRLYVSDMDGTLLDPGARLSARTRDGLLRLLDAGVPFTVATARSPQSIGHILDGVPLTLPVVALHGALLSDLSTRRHVRVRAVTRETAETAIDTARALKTSLWLSTHDGERDHVSRDTLTNDGSRWYDDELIANGDPRRRLLDDVTAALDEQVVCFTIMDREPVVRRAAGMLAEALPDDLTVHVFENAYSPGWWWINAHARSAGLES